MTKTEAIANAYRRFPKKVVRSCKEYSTGFLVEVVPEGEEKSNKRFLDSTYLVDKETGALRTYMPGMIPDDEIEKPDISSVFKKIRGK